MCRPCAWLRGVAALAGFVTLGVLANVPAQVIAHSTSMCASTHVRGTPFSIVMHRGRVSCSEAQKIIHTFQKGGGTEHGTGSNRTWAVDGWNCIHGPTASECFKGGASYAHAPENIEAFIRSKLPTAPIGTVLTVHERGNALLVSAGLRDSVTANRRTVGKLKPGYRFVAVFLGFTNNDYGTISGDANFTSIIGSDGLTYRFDAYAWLGSSPAECGELHLGPMPVGVM